MKISAEIIVRDLMKKLAVKVFGTPSKELALKRVEFYEPSQGLRKGLVYITDSFLPESLPELPKESILIYVNDQAESTWQHIYSSKANYGAVIVIEDKHRLAIVFNAVQEIFEYYSEWDEKLQTILQTTGRLKDMVEVSSPIFGNTIAVCNQNLKTLAYSEVSTTNEDDAPSFLTHGEPEFLFTVSSKEIKSVHASNKRKRHPYFHNKKQSYCINLYIDDCYSGLVCLNAALRPLDDADLVLFGYFADILLVVYKKYSTVLSSMAVNLRNVVHDLMNGVSVSQTQLDQAVDTSSHSEQFVCIQLRQASATDDLPIEYVCGLAENYLPGSVALLYDSVILILLSLTNCPFKYDEILRTLAKFLKECDFIAGISNAFRDVKEARSYFKQAELALDIGSKLNDKHLYFHFRDYALPYMVRQATLELEPQFFLTPGLLNLKMRQSRGTADYWETLRVYLENKMNASETAKALFLHRSTLHQRLSRINSILDLDLEDYQSRLYVELCIYLVELHEKNGIA